MDDDRQIAKEGRIVRLHGGVEVKVFSQERIGGDFAVFPTQVADLASLGLGVIASRRLATTERV